MKRASLFIVFVGIGCSVNSAETRSSNATYDVIHDAGSNTDSVMQEDSDTCSSVHCETDSILSTKPIALVKPDQWTTVSTENDPFKPQESWVVCGNGTYGVEGTYFEVETGQCNYITVEQASLENVAVDDSIRIVMWHLPLGKPDVTEAYVAIQIDQELLWEQTISLPAEAKVYEVTVKTKAHAAMGVPVYFHVKNHGANSWRLLLIEAI